MTEVEKMLIYEYFFNYETRLEESVDVWDIRATRRRLDSVDHLLLLKLDVYNSP